MPSPLLEMLPTAVNLLIQQSRKADYKPWSLISLLVSRSPPRCCHFLHLCLFINIPKGVWPCSIYVTTLHLSPRTKRHTSTANAQPILSLFSSDSFLQKFEEITPTSIIWILNVIILLYSIFLPGLLWHDVARKDSRAVWGYTAHGCLAESLLKVKQTATLNGK